MLRGKDSVGSNGAGIPVGILARNRGTLFDFASLITDCGPRSTQGPAATAGDGTARSVFTAAHQRRARSSRRERRASTTHSRDVVARKSRDGWLVTWRAPVFESLASSRRHWGISRFP